MGKNGQNVPTSNRQQTQDKSYRYATSGQAASAPSKYDKIFTLKNSEVIEKLQGWFIANETCGLGSLVSIMNHALKDIKFLNI
jgi:hypothetical protein